MLLEGIATTERITGVAAARFAPAAPRDCRMTGADDAAGQVEEMGS